MTPIAIKIKEINVSRNVHPNTDRSPWGWLQSAKDDRTRFATWTGYDEEERCKLLKSAYNNTYGKQINPESVEMMKKVLSDILKSLEDCDYVKIIPKREMHTRIKEALNAAAK